MTIQSPALARRAPFLLFLLMTLLGVARIASTYRPISQTSDETPNIACGMEWLDLGTYNYGPFHPPLARIAIAIGPYLYGARSQKLPDRWPEGNAVLNSAPRYSKALTLAREGILPFFILACVCVWLWSRRLLGDWGALAPVFLFTNLPPVLAHAGVATSDMAVGAGVCAALLAFVVWLDEPRLRNTLLLGCAMAAAFLSKFSSVLFVPACFLVILGLSRLRRPKRPARMLRYCGLALLTTALLVWGAYGFTWGTMTENVAGDAAGQTGAISKVPPSFWRALEKTPVPAPKILDGLWQVHNHADAGHAAYLLGRNSMRGWWYFFPVALAVKTPLAVLLLAGAGIFGLARERARKFDWRYWAPLASALTILALCMPATLNIGVRYMLPLYPMMAIVAGLGAVYLFRRPGRFWRAVAAVLLLWTAVSSLSAHPDYIAYFNELAGSRPERILVDSDLDWGQDMHLLVKELKQRRVPYLHMACLYTGDDSRLALPPWDGLDPFQRVTGWVAISFTKMKTHGWLVGQQRGVQQNGYAWLERYQPVTRVGKSILLYYVPERPR